MKEKTPNTCVMDLEKARNRRQLTGVLKSLLEEARNGTLKYAAIRVYYKDGTNEVKLIGGMPEEQAEALAELEAKEAKRKALMEELRPLLDEVFAHLPEEERCCILHSKERLRLALSTLPDGQLEKLSLLILERLKMSLDQ